MLVTFEGLNIHDLDVERRDIEGVDDVLKRLPEPNDPSFDELSQQSNFRLKPGRGRVDRLEVLNG